MFDQGIIDNFWLAFSVSLKGMTGIFIFMLVFFLMIKLIDNVFPKK